MESPAPVDPQNPFVCLSVGYNDTRDGGPWAWSVGWPVDAGAAMRVARYVSGSRSGRGRAGLITTGLAGLLLAAVLTCAAGPASAAAGLAIASAPTPVPGADIVRFFAPPGPLSQSALAPAAVDRSLVAFRAAMLAEINARRAEAGALPVTEDPGLDDATQKHAGYLVTNGPLWDAGVNGAAFSGHKEVAGLPGFYAVSFDDRDRLSGYAYPWREDVLRVMNDPFAWTAATIIRSWIDAPLHRRSILDPELRHIGFGYAHEGIYQAYVLDVGTGPLQPAPVSIFVYPCDGQKGVATSWDGNESPQPFPQLASWQFPTGYVLTAFPVTAGEDFESAQLTLVRAGDKLPVSVVQSPGTNGIPNYCWASLTPLEPSTTYEVTLIFKTGMGRNGALRLIDTRTWSFTTGAGSGGPGSTTTSTVPTTTTTTTATTTTTTATTTTLPSTSTTTLPTTTTTTAPPVTFADVPQNHPYRAAIELIAGRGIVEGRDGPGGARVFAPDDPVMRQQLAKMVVLSLGLTVTTSDIAPSFPDVPTSDVGLYPDHYIAVAAREHIVEGYPPVGATAGLFKPYASVTRAQLVTMVVRATKVRASGWLSVLPAEWSGQTAGYRDPTHGENLHLAELNGLLVGIRAPGGTLAGWDPTASATRGEVAQILADMLRLIEG